MNNPQRTQLDQARDDHVTVDRESLIVVLRWCEQQATPILVTSAGLRLQRQLIQPESDSHSESRNGASHRAGRITVAVCSALVLVGVGIAWLLLVVTR